MVKAAVAAATVQRGKGKGRRGQSLRQDQKCSQEPSQKDCSQNLTGRSEAVLAVAVENEATFKKEGVVT